MDVGTAEFMRFAKLAHERGLDYMVIGGLALNFHGILRNTVECDIWLNPSEANFRVLADMLLDMGYDPEHIKKMTNLPINEAMVFGIEGPIDILTQVRHLFDFKESRARALEYFSNETLIPVLALTDVRELKVKAKRPQDLRDVLMIDEYLEKINLKK